MNKEKLNFDTITPKLVLGQLFKSRNVMHIVHLKTQSFAVHKASQEYYDTLLTLTDDLAETHFGVTGKKELDLIPAAQYMDPEMHLNDIYYYLSSNRHLFTSDEEANIIDEILALISKTKYLLTLS